MSQRNDTGSSQEEPSPELPALAELEIARGTGGGCRSAMGWYYLLDKVWPHTFADWKGEVLLEGWLRIRELKGHKHNHRGHKIMKKVSQLGSMAEGAAHNLMSTMRDDEGTHGVLVGSQPIELPPGHLPVSFPASRALPTLVVLSCCRSMLRR